MKYPRRLESVTLSQTEDGWAIEPAGQDRIHSLSPTAVLILELCDGGKTPADIAALLAEAYRLTGSPVETVQEALSQLDASGLIEWADSDPS